MSSRKEQKEQLRAERIAREQQAQAAERRRRLLAWGAGGILAIAAIAAIVFLVTSGGGGGPSGDEPTGETGQFPAGTVPAPGEDAGDLEAATRAADCDLEDPPNEGDDHVDTTVAYESNPPTSGNHAPIPAEDGAYTEAPPTEALVHSLEHGRILIQYPPNAPDELKGQLKALFDEDPYHMVLVPNETGMPYAVAATAWGRLLGCDTASDEVFDAIRAFRDEYRDKGPEFIP